MINKNKMGMKAGSGSPRKPGGDTPRGGNGVDKHDEQANTDRNQHGPDPVGPGKVIKTD